MKHIYYLLLLSTFMLFSCAKDDPSIAYSKLRPNEIGTFKNTQGGYSYVAALPDEAKSLDVYAAEIQGEFTYTSNLHPILEHGHCWSKSEKEPVIVETASNFTELGEKTDDIFISNLLNLERETSYYVRSYVKTAEGISYNPSVLEIKTVTPSNYWEEQDVFPGMARYGAVSFNMQDTAFIGLGDDGLTYRRDVWKFDSENGWRQIADFGGDGRVNAVGFAIDNKAYVGTGTIESNGGTNMKDFWKYDNTNNLWAEVGELSGFARYDAVGFSLKGKGYVGLGKDNSNLNDFQEYDPSTETWNPASSYPGSTGYSGAVAFTIRNTKAYVGTGISQDGAVSNFYEFNPDDESWNSRATFPGGARYNARSFVIGTESYTGFIIGGTDGTTNYKDVWEYDVIENQWRKVSEFEGEYREKPVAFATEDRAYYGLGKIGSEKKKDFWMYIPENK